MRARGELQRAVMAAITRAQRAEQEWTYATLAAEFDVTVQAIQGAIDRLRKRGLVYEGKRRVMKQGLVAVGPLAA